MRRSGTSGWGSVIFVDESGQGMGFSQWVGASGGGVRKVVSPEEGREIISGGGHQEVVHATRTVCA